MGWTDLDIRQASASCVWSEEDHLIQEEDLGVPQQRSCNGNALLLSARHLDALLPRVGVVPTDAAACACN